MDQEPGDMMMLLAALPAWSGPLTRKTRRIGDEFADSLERSIFLIWFDHHNGHQADLMTLPAVMQLVQTTIFCVRPLCTARTLCKLGLKRRLVTLCA
jgi:hypothetical protein